MDQAFVVEIVVRIDLVQNAVDSRNILCGVDGVIYRAHVQLVQVVQEVTVVGHAFDAVEM